MPSLRFNEAIDCLHHGREADAERLCRVAIDENPADVEAHRLLAEILIASRRSAEAIEVCRRVAELAPHDAPNLRRLGSLLSECGNAAEAIGILQRSLDVEPDNARALNNLGNCLMTVGRTEEAVDVIRRAITLNPGYAIAVCNLGLALTRLGRHSDALNAYEEAIVLQRSFPAAALARIRSLLTLGRPQRALEACDELLATRPELPAVRGLRAQALLKLDRIRDGLEAARQAAAADPNDAEAFISLGLALVLGGSVELSFPAFERALELRPASAKAHGARALACAAAGRVSEALMDYERAAALDPSDPSVFYEVGRLMLRLGRLDNAHAAFDRAVTLQPDDWLALEGRTKTLAALHRHEDALTGFLALRAVTPPLDYLRGAKLHSELHCCDWKHFDDESRIITECVRRGERADSPFSFLVHNDSPADQRRCAEIYVLDRFPDVAPASRRARRGGTRLRVAYLSADFGDHPVAQLLAGVLERHDRSRFEVYAFSAGRDDGSALRKRLRDGVEHFLDVADLQDAAIAARMADESIDVAVDLGGHTTGSRTRALASRPAPVQVAFLGYPGTLGASFIDYLVADRHVVPDGEQLHYAEQMIYLPDSYLPTDFGLAASATPAASVPDRPAPHRRSAGLPAAGVVFCCFNAAYKILPTVFAIWMRVLKKVPGGVLWLRDSSAAAKRHLAEEAVRHGIAPERLIYAPKVATLEDHRARLALADLFLDTWPYNAHTTASDALGAGVPVLTRRGGSFASRVATSLLHAVGLEKLSVDTAEGYEALAVELGGSPGALLELKTYLQRSRVTAPLFDTVQYCRHLESAYVEIGERHARGEKPSTLWVERTR